MYNKIYLDELINILKDIINRISNIITNPNDSKLWRIDENSEIGYIIKMIGSKDLLEAIGFKKTTDSKKVEYILENSSNNYTMDELPKNIHDKLLCIRFTLLDEILDIMKDLSINKIIDEFIKTNIRKEVLKNGLEYLKSLIDTSLNNNKSNWTVPLKLIRNNLKFDKKYQLIQSIGYIISKQNAILLGLIYDKDGNQIISQQTLDLLKQRRTEIELKIEEFIKPAIKPKINDDDNKGNIFSDEKNDNTSTIKKHVTFSSDTKTSPVKTSPTKATITPVKQEEKNEDSPRRRKKLKIPRVIEKQIEEKDKKIKTLQQELIDTKQDLSQALDHKDVMAVERMSEKEKKRLKTVAKKADKITGLEPKFQTNLNKLLTNTAAEQDYKAEKAIKEGSTTLLKEARIGDCVLQLASTAGFDKNDKIIIGNPPRCETRFIKEIEPFIIDAPLKLSFRVREKVQKTESTKKEKRKLKKKLISEMTRDIVLEIADNSCDKAEEIVQSRRTQNEYQRRPINKSTFYDSEIFKFNFPPTNDINCGFTFFSKFGRIFIFHDKTIWCFKEGFRLNDLRQIFDDCDENGDGKINTKDYVNILLNHQYIIPIIASHPFDKKMDMNLFESKLHELENFKEEISWRDFLHFFRYGAEDLPEVNELSEIQGSWRREPWASVLKDEDVIKIKKVFNQYDINGVGEIKLDELNTIFWEINGVASSNDNLKQWFKEIDTDGSGTISFPEFVNFILKAAENNTVGQSFNFTLVPDKDLKINDENSINKLRNTSTSLSLSEYLSLLKPRNVFDIVFCQPPKEIISTKSVIYEIKSHEESGRLILVRDDFILEVHDCLKGTEQANVKLIENDYNNPNSSINKIKISDFYPQNQILDCDKISGIIVVNLTFISGEVLFFEPILCNKIHSVKCDLQLYIKRSIKNKNFKEIKNKDGKMSTIGCINHFYFLYDYSLLYFTICGSSIIFGINVLSGDLICELQGHIDSSPILYYSPESKCLISGGTDTDSTIRVWDLGEELYWRLEIIQRKRFYEDIREKHTEATEAGEKWNKLVKKIMDQFIANHISDEPRIGLIIRTYPDNYCDIQYNDNSIESEVWKGRLNLPEDKRIYITEDNPVSVYPVAPSFNILVHLLHNMDYQNSGKIKAKDFQDILKYGLNLILNDDDINFILSLFDKNNEKIINYIEFLKLLKTGNSTKEIYSTHLRKLIIIDDREREGKLNITINQKEKWKILQKRLQLMFSDYQNDIPKEGIITRYYEKDNLVDVHYSSGEKERNIWIYRLDLPDFYGIKQGSNIKVYPIVVSLGLLSRYLKVMDSHENGCITFDDLKMIIRNGLNLSIDDVDIQFIFDLFKINDKFNYEEFIKQIQPNSILKNDPYIIKAKHILEGHKEEITGLTYLKESRLIASSSKDGTIKLWDPMACHYRLTHPSSIAHVRVGPGKYVLPQEQWTYSTNPYYQCWTINIKNDRLKFRFASNLNSPYLQCSSISCPVYADKDTIKKSKECEDLLKFENGGVCPSCCGYIYLMNDGTMFDISMDHFDTAYITLRDNETFLEQEIKSVEEGIDMSALQKVLSERHKVKRILFGGSTDYDNLRQLTHRLTKEGVLSLTYDDILHILSNPIVHFTLFYCSGDGPNNICTLEGKEIEKFNNEFRLYSGIVISDIINNRVDIAYDKVNKIENVPIDSLRSPFDTDLNKNINPSLISKGSPVLVKSSYLSANLDEDNVISQHFDALDILIGEITHNDGTKSILSWSIGRINIRVRAMDYDIPFTPVTIKYAKLAYKNHFQYKFQQYRSRISMAMGRSQQEEELHNRLYITYIYY